VNPVAAKQRAAPASSSGSVKPSCSIEIGAAAAARDRAVAVLDDGHPAGGRQQRRSGGQIEAAGGIAAGADDVDRIEQVRQLRLARQRAHRAGEAAHFGRVIPLARSAASTAPASAGASAGIGQQAEQRKGLRPREIAAFQQMLEQ
jgi:hypothetical protein